MLKHVQLPAVIVDIETTGGNVTYDRITEIGIVEVTENGVTEWSTLINPRMKIPPMIQRITGITDAMVESAPYFEQVAKEILLRLQGKLFIAHNVRFDYGFIRNEFSRLAFTFKAPLLCTVKMSRALYPDRDGHSLEKIIARHQIMVQSRHRALDDARATFKFIQIAEEENSAEKVRAALQSQNRRGSLPVGFDPALVEALPNSPGVYYFWGEAKELLYIGKSINIRKRVLSHFTADHRSSKEMKICQQTRHITFDQTSGELTALILESQKIKALQPLYNRKLRRVSNLYSIQLEDAGNNTLVPKIVSLNDNLVGRSKLYGLYPSAKNAKQDIQTLCDQHGLCYQLAGLEHPGNRACTSHQLKKCAGYCIGKSSVLIHNVKMLEGFSALALKAWPYDGPVVLIEPDQHQESATHLLIDNWRILGVAQSEADYADILNGANAQPLDKDIYKYLVSAILGKASRYKIYPLPPIS
ncbi:exonuclease domain-containing protein [Cellvibrio polysaccharolyticus]|uniref:DNA-directed DNA polymerase n=1 Tax=Cellvibrio polysaccharolyticus TaxID=2082724 RepID=A0A928V6M4_9GAMM|nr:exonuclease domain-containing protein [Cellvibrio polysaccharolyticus]MBE8717519.1 ethanolamine utilization protein [Cellvibrio polysaccharolyticus]